MRATVAGRGWQGWQKPTRLLVPVALLGMFWPRPPPLTHHTPLLSLTMQDLAGGLALLAELERTPRLELNQYPYNIALRMCADVGELGAALRLLGRMRGGSGGGGDEAAAAPAGRPVRRRVATDQRTYG